VEDGTDVNEVWLEPARVCLHEGGASAVVYEEVRPSSAPLETGGGRYSSSSVWQARLNKGGAFF
jgi:hypothetical protein